MDDIIEYQQCVKLHTPSDSSEQNEDSLLGTPFDFQVIADEQGRRLKPVKEDLAVWVSGILGIDITAETFLDVLDNGVYVCRLAEHIQRAMAADGKTAQGIPLSLPHLRYREDAQHGSFFARDNVTLFLKWCRSCGMRQEILFDSAGLVEHKQPREVVLCLLELSRIGARFGIEPPSLVKMEKEMESEEMEVEQEQEELIQSLKLNNSLSFDTSILLDVSMDDESCNDDDSTNQPTHSSNDTKSNAGKTKTKSGRRSSLDEEVVKLSKTVSFEVNRLSEGKYLIGEKIVLVRLLNKRHVMVRVGGGWDTFEHFLLHHNPTKMEEHMHDGSGGKYLFMRGNYKQIVN